MLMLKATAAPLNPPKQLRSSEVDPVGCFSCTLSPPAGKNCNWKVTTRHWLHCHRLPPLSVPLHPAGFGKAAALLLMIPPVLSETTGSTKGHGKRTMLPQESFQKNEKLATIRATAATIIILQPQQTPTCTKDYGSTGPAKLWNLPTTPTTSTFKGRCRYS
jgi:hypothetical protein